MKTITNLQSKLTMLAASVLLSSAAFSQARVQIIHNSADAATQTVDIYAGTTLLLDDFQFRTASPFIDVAAGTVPIGIAPGNSSSSADVLATFPLTVVDGETYVAIANGILSGSGYAPAPGVTVDVYALGQEQANTVGNTDVLVFHGSTDAPTVDVSTPGGSAMPLVDDASYGDFAGYLELPTNDYTLNVTDATGATVVKSYSAPLSTLGLQDAAIVVVASGFLDPSMNSNGDAFGLWVALPTGGALVELPEATSRLQIIHNSADALAAEVDIYLNGTLLLDDFAFRTATPFVDVPAEVENSIAVAPSNSTSVAMAVATVPATFSVNETYIAIANGIISPTGYAPATAFSLDVFEGAREASAVTGNTDVLVFHGSTDAPTVDVDEATAGNLVDNAAYSNFAGYLELGTADYTLQVKDDAGAANLFQYSAPLATLNLQDAAITVVASGFVDPSVNSNGANFGLWVALPAGGALVELPTSTLSVKEFEKDLNIFPNPTTGQFQINGIENGSNIEIYDMTGKVVMSEIINNTQILSLEGFKSGTYMLSIQTAEQKIIKKIALQ
ncbi:MAG: DUF4397 domain-containing protein [Crocinitomicaceae bacterium]